MSFLGDFTLSIEINCFYSLPKTSLNLFQKYRYGYLNEPLWRAGCFSILKIHQRSFRTGIRYAIDLYLMSITDVSYSVVDRNLTNFYYKNAFSALKRFVEEPLLIFR